MISTKSKVVVALSGLALAAVVLPGAIAAGTNGPPPVPITGGGVLRLHMAKDADFFRFDPPTGSGQPTADAAHPLQEVRGVPQPGHLARDAVVDAQHRRPASSGSRTTPSG